MCYLVIYISNAGSPHESQQLIPPSHHRQESPRRSVAIGSTHLSLNRSRLPQKKVYPLQHDKAMSHAAVMVDMGSQTEEDHKENGPSMVSLCKEMVSMTLERIRGELYYPQTQFSKV